MAWNLNDYEDVATLNRWYQDNYPAGRIQLVIVHEDWENQEVVVKCCLYRDIKDEEPAVVNLARGKASDYPKNMQRWYLEDTATSAIGRAILLIKGANKTATQDSMRQVISGDGGHKVEHPWKPADAKPVENEPETFVWDTEQTTAFKNEQDILDHLQGELGATLTGFECKHGPMTKREGTGKTGRPFYGYTCISRDKNDQCEARWAKFIGGKWVFESRAVNYGG